MRKRFMLAAIPLLVLLAAVVSAATISTQDVRVAGVGPVHFTTQGPSGSTVAVLGIDTSESPVKKAIVQKVTVNGQEVDILVRIHKAGGALWVDLVADANINSLTTTVTSLSIGATSVGHPAPTKDLIDGTAMTAAGGS